MILSAKELKLSYGTHQVLHSVSLDFYKNEVCAIIGPSGCGKSTLLRSLNRMNDFVNDIKIEGKVIFQGLNIYDKNIDPVEIRKHIGMVFQKPNPFPKSIYDNIIWGPKINGMRTNYDELVELSLRRAALWDEVKDRLDNSAFALSGGQQQRLCIARAIAMSPEIILMDEPCSALDPKATAKIEELILELKERYTIIIVTHNMQQAARISDKTAFMYEGNLIEHDLTSNVFTSPKQKRTEDYITGRFG